LNRADLSKLAEDNPPYAELVERHDNKLGSGLVEDYVATANACDVQKEYVNGIMREDGILGMIVWFHEAVEATTLIDDFGMDEEDVRSGLANRLHYAGAHKIAIKREFGLISHFCGKVLDSRIPPANFAVTHPLGDYLVAEKKIHPNDVIDNMLLRLDTALPDLCNPNSQVDETSTGIGFRLFDELGYQYKQRGLIKEKLRSKVAHGKLRTDLLNSILRRAGLNPADFNT